MYNVYLLLIEIVFIKFLIDPDISYIQPVCLCARIFLENVTNH